MNEPATAVVTGGTSGIGFAVAQRLANDGYAVVTGSNEKPSAALPSGITYAPLDVRDTSSIDGFFAQVDGFSGPFEILVNCAGVAVFKDFAQITPEELREVIETNLTGTFLCSQQAVRRMASRGGRIINLGSVSDHQALPQNSAYAASKFGVRGLSSVMNEDLKQAGVRVTLLSLGAVSTRLWASHSGEKKNKMLAVDEVADVVAYVARSPLSVRLDEIKMLPEEGVV